MIIPELDIDLFSDQALRDPYPLYARIRDAGPVVRLPRYDTYVMGRHADVRAALLDWTLFSSAQGTTLNEAINATTSGTMLNSDPPDHDRMRKMIAPPLFPKTLRDSTPLIEAEAEALVARLVARGGFDAVEDLAWHLPTTVVTSLVGLPEEGREQMRHWGIAGFDAGGPAGHPRTDAAMPAIFDMVGYVLNPDLPGRVAPGSWAARLFAVGQEQGLTQRESAALLIDYVAPSLDTTVSGLTGLIWNLGRHPEAWAAIRSDPALIPQAIQESLRLETPIRMFSRVTTAEASIDGVTVPAGTRLALLYGSANRDERKWLEPERFDLSRRPSDHVAFGYGVHSCMGMHLAQLEMRSVLTSLAARVGRIELGEPVRLDSSFLRGFARLPVTVA